MLLESRCIWTNGVFQKPLVWWRSWHGSHGLCVFIHLVTAVYTSFTSAQVSVSLTCVLNCHSERSPKIFHCDSALKWQASLYSERHRGQVVGCQCDIAEKSLSQRNDHESKFSCKGTTNWLRDSRKEDIHEVRQALLLSITKIFVSLQIPQKRWKLISKKSGGIDSYGSQNSC